VTTSEYWYRLPGEQVDVRGQLLEKGPLVTGWQHLQGVGAGVQLSGQNREGGGRT